VSEYGDEPTWFRPIPGDPRPILDEIERLSLIKERLWAVADDLMVLDVDWSGPSYEHFIQFKTDQSRQWRYAGDLHGDTASALSQYHTALIELQRQADEIVRSASHGADPTRATAAWADVERLRQQLHGLGSDIARSIQDCASVLATFQALPQLGSNGPQLAPAVPDTVAEPPPAPAARPVELPQWTPSTGSIYLDPRLASTDPAGFERNVRVLVAEIIVGTHYFVPDQPPN
jgi:hypothetical protein